MLIRTQHRIFQYFSYITLCTIYQPKLNFRYWTTFGQKVLLKIWQWFLYTLQLCLDLIMLRLCAIMPIPGACGRRQGTAPGWVASSLQRPTWAFGGSVHCSRLPQQCSEGLNREASPISYRLSCLPLTVFHQLSKNILSLIHVTIMTNILTSPAPFKSTES